MQYDLGYFDDETCRLEPIENPFWTESVTHPPGIKCHLSAQNRPKESGAPCRTRTCDLLVRSQTLYPAELRARAIGFRFGAVSERNSEPARLSEVDGCRENAKTAARLEEVLGSLIGRIVYDAFPLEIDQHGASARVAQALSALRRRATVFRVVSV
jgi:hypothetical protein